MPFCLGRTEAPADCDPAPSAWQTRASHTPTSPPPAQGAHPHAPRAQVCGADAAAGCHAPPARQRVGHVPGRRRPAQQPRRRLPGRRRLGERELLLCFACLTVQGRGNGRRRGPRSGCVVVQPRICAAQGTGWLRVVRVVWGSAIPKAPARRGRALGAPTSPNRVLGLCRTR